MVVVLLVVVVLVAVVVLTRCMTQMSIHESQRDAPNHGGRVPVDTAPGPVPVHRALKIPTSAHHRDNTTAPVELAPPAKQGRRTPCPRATGNFSMARKTMETCLCVTTGM